MTAKINRGNKSGSQAITGDRTAAVPLVIVKPSQANLYFKYISNYIYKLFMVYLYSYKAVF